MCLGLMIPEIRVFFFSFGHKILSKKSRIRGC
jgi:hypothetical protein